MLFTLYTCKEALLRLDDYVDRELTPREMQLVERHLKICRACARKFRFEKAFQDGLRAKVQNIAVPDDLKNNVQALLKRIRTQP